MMGKDKTVKIPQRRYL